MEIGGRSGYGRAGVLIAVVGIAFGLLGYTIFYPASGSVITDPTLAYWPQFLQYSGSIMLALGLAILIVGRLRRP